MPSLHRLHSLPFLLLFLLSFITSITAHDHHNHAAGGQKPLQHAVPGHIPLPDDFDQVDRTPPQTIVIMRWPVSAGSDESKRVGFGMVRYAAGTVTARYSSIVKGTEEGDKEIYRVGTLRKGKWVGTLMDSKSLRDNVDITITLRVDDEGNVWHVRYDGKEVPQGVEKSEPEVAIVRPIHGVEPVLNKPVILTAEGKTQEPVVEKTFLQKYWMVILGMGVVFLFSGGDAK